MTRNQNGERFSLRHHTEVDNRCHLSGCGSTSRFFTLARCPTQVLVLGEGGRLNNEAGYSIYLVLLRVHIRVLARRQAVGCEILAGILQDLGRVRENLTRPGRPPPITKRTLGRSYDEGADIDYGVRSRGLFFGANARNVECIHGILQSGNLSCLLATLITSGERITRVDIQRTTVVPGCDRGLACSTAHAVTMRGTYTRCMVIGSSWRASYGTAMACTSDLYCRRDSAVRSSIGVTVGEEEELRTWYLQKLFAFMLSSR
ncbi:hypothetical protein EDD18DRAFT_1336720 [Armillaria luteobubalina]|uniref:Uncharacterized protein n=1 Tax=Armillaria luteobubalina TaxID=153913 RepID=A0AA39PDE3_9AGAR|nr:hypothetical protein EDD18DRAFT_1336720 [Armillaria luteobubalina]